MANDDTKKFFEELVNHDDPSVPTSSRAHHHKPGSPKSKEAEDGGGQLAIDVYRSGDNIIIESPIAGVDPSQIDIQITSEEVSINGQRAKYEEIHDEDYYYQECYWGRFSRSVILPDEIDAEASEATIKNGILRIKMPLETSKKGKKLKVKMG